MRTALFSNSLRKPQHGLELVRTHNGAVMGGRTDAFRRPSDGYPRSFDTITLGNGTGDTVQAIFSRHDVIALGDGAGDAVNVGRSNDDTVTLGDGAVTRYSSLTVSISAAMTKLLSATALVTS